MEAGVGRGSGDGGALLQRRAEDGQVDFRLRSGHVDNDHVALVVAHPRHRINVNGICNCVIDASITL